MKYDVKAFDEIKTLEEAKEIIKMMVSSQYLHNQAYQIMNKEQIIALLYDLSDDYIATNYERNANDVSYYLGLKDGIEGFRRHMLYYLMNYCE
jgi:hypothetical protein